MRATHRKATQADAPTRAVACLAYRFPQIHWGTSVMVRSLIVCLVLGASVLVFDAPEAQAHRRWVVRRPVAHAVLGPPVWRRRVYRPYYRPRVVVGVGVGGGYYW